MSRAGGGAHVFVDESKAGDYLLAAATVARGDLTKARGHVKSLRHRGSSSIHMRTESDQSKRRIIDGLIDFKFETMMVVGRRDGPELDRRRDCLATVARHCALMGAARLVIERDDSLVSHDRQSLVTEARRLDTMPEYVWLARNEEPLLWVSDAVAWCYAKGGQWRSRAQPLVCSEVPAATAL